MTNHVIIWDIETIPDLQRFAAANYLTGKADSGIREVMGDKFPKHIYDSIVCMLQEAYQAEKLLWCLRSFMRSP